MAPPPPLPPRTRKYLPDAGSPVALLPQRLPPTRRGGDLLPAPGGRRLESRCAAERCPGSTALQNAGAGSSSGGRTGRAPVRARGPCGAMNGTANPLLDREEHCLRLGESFEKRPRASFHTIRCKSALPTAPFGRSGRLLPTLASKIRGTPCLRQLPPLLPLNPRDLDFLPSPSRPSPANPSQTKPFVTPNHSSVSWPQTLLPKCIDPFLFSSLQPALPLCQTSPSLLPKGCDPTSDSSSSSNPPPFLITHPSSPRLKDSSVCS